MHTRTPPRWDVELVAVICRDWFHFCRLKTRMGGPGCWVYETKKTVTVFPKIHTTVVDSTAKAYLHLKTCLTGDLFKKLHRRKNGRRVALVSFSDSFIKHRDLIIGPWLSPDQWSLLLMYLTCASWAIVFSSESFLRQLNPSSEDCSFRRISRSFFCVTILIRSLHWPLKASISSFVFWTSTYAFISPFASSRTAPASTPCPAERERHKSEAHQLSAVLGEQQQPKSFSEMGSDYREMICALYLVRQEVLPWISGNLTEKNRLKLGIMM